MFNPSYTISHQLLENIKRINSLINELNNTRFTHVVLVEFQRKAREVSAHASTSIEGNPLPLTAVIELIKNKPSNLRDSETEVLNYNHALENLDKLIDNKVVQIDVDLILKIHREVTQNLLEENEVGKLRNKPVVVNDPRVNKVVYIPPDFKDVDSLMLNLVTFINKNINSIDPLILAGLLHKQMVIIHPFMDGNGRTTRLITKFLLANMGLNTFKLFSFENYYNQNVTKYFQNVGEFGDYYEIKDRINFTNWLEYFTGGIIDELIRVKNVLPDYIGNPKNKLEKYHQNIIEYIKNKGFITNTDYSKLVKRSKASRVKDFNDLIDMGIISRNGGGRSTYYTLR
ncbi:MAG: Fic family protein [bacterium]|nr:MAG: Fic family protein [bacterium]